MICDAFSEHLTYSLIVGYHSVQWTCFGLKSKINITGFGWQYHLRASPKSTSLRVKSFLREIYSFIQNCLNAIAPISMYLFSQRMFSGFMSRWTMFLACKYSTAGWESVKMNLPLPHPTPRKKNLKRRRKPTCDTTKQPKSPARICPTNPATSRSVRS